MTEPRRSSSEAIAALLTERLATPGLAPAAAAACRRWNAILSPEKAERWAAVAPDRPERSEQLLLRAIRLVPGDFRFHFNLSNRMLLTGDPGSASRSLKRVMLLQPSFPKAYGNLAPFSQEARVRLGLQARAWVSGGNPASGVSAAERLAARERHVPADEILTRILAESPLLSEAWRQRAISRHIRRDLRAARRDHCRALVTNPGASDNYLAAYGHFSDCRMFDAAERMLRCAESITPRSLAVHINRGSLLEAMDRPVEALEYARRSVLREPGNAEINFNTATAYASTGDLDRALRFHARTSLIAPGEARLKNNHAIALLKAGQYRRGFEAYEYRWQAPVVERPSVRVLHPVPSFDLPVWEPGADGATRVLLWGEQGLGDEIWGLGCLPALSGRRERFDVETDSRLVPVARWAFPDIGFFARTTERPVDCSAYDAQLPLLSIAHKLECEEAPFRFGWARPHASRIAEIGAKLRKGREVRVIGLGWRSVKPLAHWSFDLSLERLGALASLDNVLFLPLQYGMTEKDWDTVTAMFGADRVARPDFDVWDDIAALAETMSAIDIVVTAATMLVPLSISVGTPAIALLREKQRDWRYAPGKRTSPMLPGVDLLWPMDGAGHGDIAAAVENALGRRPGDVKG